MNSIINTSADENNADCNEGTNDCICRENDTYLEETAKCIQLQCGEAELVSTANLAALNCALTGGWGNVNGPAQFVSMAGPPPSSATLGESEKLGYFSANGL
jgi:hypothetical protein